MYIFSCITVCSIATNIISLVTGNSITKYIHALHWSVTVGSRLVTVAYLRPLLSDHFTIFHQWAEILLYCYSSIHFSLNRHRAFMVTVCGGIEGALWWSCLAIQSSGSNLLHIGIFLPDRSLL